MEDLNKNQVILLALLVSFVGSVATSIMTYSLLSEAPPAVTQTVNRVVERTVETVVPAQIKPDVVTREVTVVVQEEDLVIDAIAKNESSLARIWKFVGQDKVFVGLGTLLKSGVLVTGKLESSDGVSMEAVLPDGSILPLTSPVIKEFASYFKIDLPADSKLKTGGSADSNTLQLGQTVIALKGSEKNSVSIGRVVSLESIESVESSKFSLIETDVEQNEVGSPIVNLKGEIVGIGTSSAGSFIPINLIKKEIETV